MKLYRTEFSSPLGTILFASDGRSVCVLNFEFIPEKRFREVEWASGDPLDVRCRLERYFSGEIAALDSLPAEPEGTPFQKRVWEGLRTIPAGQTRSYGEMAVQLGCPTSSRAVGHANSQNPVALIIPCHRVIGASRQLTGYAGGLRRKRWLLEHEGALARTLF